jgi:hypothetical protein
MNFRPARTALPTLLQAVVLLAVPGVATASSPGSWTALERDAARACVLASSLRDAVVLESTVRFDDSVGVDARLVRGTRPQPHMKGAQVLMLCLYDRKARLAQVQDAEAWRGSLETAPKR